MKNKKIFTATEKRIIRAMYRLNRHATVNEIAQCADNMSWNTAKEVIKKLEMKGIISLAGTAVPRWKIRRFE